MNELRSAIAVQHTATDTSAWDGPENEANLSHDTDKDYSDDYHQAFAWVDPKGDPNTKTAYKFIHHFVSSSTGKVGAASTVACSAGIGVLNGGRGGTVIPAGDVQGVYNHLAAHLKDAKMNPPELDAREGAPKGCTVRSSFMPGAIDLRAGADGKNAELFGHFSTFNQWYQVSSVWEGDFLERVAPGSFAKTIAEDGPTMRVLFDHGQDPAMGMKPLGPIKTLREDDEGAYYEVPLLDTDYNNNFVLPALEGRLMNGEKVGSQLGASFRFEVTGDKWEQAGKVSSVNPTGAMRRPITEARVFEFGPVTFPANNGASAGVRSTTDDFMEHLLHDSRFVAALTERAGTRVVGKMLDAARWNPGALTDPKGEGRGDASSKHLHLLRLRAEALLITRS